MADPNETGAAQETTEYDLWLKELQERKAALIEQLQSLGTEDVLRSGIAETQQELDAETEAKQGLEAQHTLLIGEQGALLQAKEKEEKAREQLETDSGNLAEQLVRIDGEDFELQLLDLDPELKEKKSAKEQAIQEREQAELDVAAVESSLEDNRQRQTWDEENRVRKDMAFHDYISKIQKEYVVLASMDELQKSNREVLEQLEKNRHIPAGTRDDLRRMAGRSGEDARTILEDLNTVIGERLSAERNAKQVSMETQDAKLGIEKPEEYFDRVKSFESSRDEVAALEEQRKMLHGLQGNPERLRELKAPLDQMIGEPERELLRLLDRYDNSFDVTDKKLTQLDSKEEAEMTGFRNLHYTGKTEEEIKRITKEGRDKAPKFIGREKDPFVRQKRLEERYGAGLYRGLLEKIRQRDESLQAQIREKNGLLTQKEKELTHIEDILLEETAKINRSREQARKGLKLKSTEELRAGQDRAQEEKFREYEKEVSKQVSADGRKETILSVQSSVYGAADDAISFIDDHFAALISGFAAAVVSGKVVQLEKEREETLKQNALLNTSVTNLFLRRGELQTQINQLSKEIDKDGNPPEKQSEKNKALKDYGDIQTAYESENRKLDANNRKLREQEEKIRAEQEKADSEIRTIKEKLGEGNATAKKAVEMETRKMQLEAEIKLQRLSGSLEAGSVNAELEAAAFNSRIRENAVHQAQQQKADVAVAGRIDFVDEFSEKTKKAFTPDNIGKVETIINSIQSCYKLYAKVKSLIDGRTEEGTEKTQSAQDTDKKDPEEENIRASLTKFQASLEKLEKSVNGTDEEKDGKTIADQIVEIATTGQAIIHGIKGKIDTLAREKKGELDTHRIATSRVAQTYAEWKAKGKEMNLPLLVQMVNEEINFRDQDSSERDRLLVEQQELKDRKKDLEDTLGVKKAVQDERERIYSDMLREKREAQKEPLKSMLSEMQAEHAQHQQKAAEHQQAYEQKQAASMQLSSEIDKKSRRIEGLNTRLGEQQATLAARREKQTDLTAVEQKLSDADQKNGAYYLASLAGVNPERMQNDPELLYQSLDKIFINGLAATVYFKAAHPELNIDKEGSAPAPNAAEMIGTQIRKYLQDGMKDNQATFVSVEGPDGMLKAVKAEGTAVNAKEYDRISAKMCEDMNEVRRMSAQSKEKGLVQKALQQGFDALTKEENRQVTMETAVFVSEGEHRTRKKTNYEELKRMDEIRRRPNHSAERNAARQNSAQHTQGTPTRRK